MKALWKIALPAALLGLTPLSGWTQQAVNGQQKSPAQAQEGEEGEEKRSGIYRSRDRHGNVLFTDDPQRAGGDDSEEVELRRSNSLPMRSPAVPDSGDEERDEEPAAYEFTIASPSEEEHFHNPGGPIPVDARVSPALQSGHRLQILYEGVPLQTSEVPWPQNRGAHTVSARVVDEEGEVVSSSEERTFFVHRASKLLSPKK